jgi:hypothetical protein
VTYSGQTGGWSESTLILTNQSQSKITRLIRVDQSQASKLVTEDRQNWLRRTNRRTTQKVTYRALGSRQSQKHFALFSLPTFVDHLIPTRNTDMRKGQQI